MSKNVTGTAFVVAEFRAEENAISALTFVAERHRGDRLGAFQIKEVGTWFLVWRVSMLYPNAS